MVARFYREFIARLQGVYCTINREFIARLTGSLLHDFTGSLLHDYREFIARLQGVYCTINREFIENINYEGLKRIKDDSDLLSNQKPH